jgi:heme/copper-type cytochrome/quinol oxidase subunit 3
MPTAIFILAAALFAADAAAHLAAVAQKKERLRRVTKVLLMPLLALAFSLCALTVYNEAPPGSSWPRCRSAAQAIRCF